MLKAILFDCDGVIADTEPLHLAILKQTLADEGIFLTDEQYYREYLALDDRGCYMKIYSQNNKDLSQQMLDALIEKKAARFEPVLQENLKLFPGVRQLIQVASAKYPLAIASGARRQEIDLILNHSQLMTYFQTIVSTEDVTEGKPHPESFLKACQRLTALDASIQPESCLVIEDSIHGIRAAHAAGMKCLAVTNSYSRDLLPKTEMVVESFEFVSLQQLEALFEHSIGQTIPSK